MNRINFFWKIVKVGKNKYRKVLDEEMCFYSVLCAAALFDVLYIGMKIIALFRG